jgi:hypothetical protein
MSVDCPCMYEDPPLPAAVVATLPARDETYLWCDTRGHPEVMAWLVLADGSIAAVIDEGDNTTPTVVRVDVVSVDGDHYYHSSVTDRRGRRR